MIIIETAVCEVTFKYQYSSFEENYFACAKKLKTGSNHLSSHVEFKQIDHACTQCWPGINFTCRDLRFCGRQGIN